MRIPFLMFRMIVSDLEWRIMRIVPEEFRRFGDVLGTDGSSDS